MDKPVKTLNLDQHIANRSSGFLTCTSQFPCDWASFLWLICSTHYSIYSKKHIYQNKTNMNTFCLNTNIEAYLCSEHLEIEKSVFLLKINLSESTNNVQVFFSDTSKHNESITMFLSASLKFLCFYRSPLMANTTMDHLLQTLSIEITEQATLYNWITYRMRSYHR